MAETFEDMSFEARSTDLDFASLGAAIHRKRRWIIISTAVGFLLAALFVAVVKPRYTGESEVLLENQENFMTGPQHVENAEPPAPPAEDTDLVGSQIQLITSSDLGRQAIEKLGLIGNPEFDPYANGLGLFTSILVALGLEKDPLRIPAADRVLDNFEQKLFVYSPTKTRVIAIEFSSRDPELAARGANVVANLYLEAQSNAKRQMAKQAAESLAAQIDEQKQEVTRAADEVERYRAMSGLLAGTNNMTIAGQQLADLSTDLSHARTEQADSQARAALIRRMLSEGRISEVPDIANNDLIRRIAEQRATAAAQLALESSTLLPGHPRIKELTAEVADLDSQLQSAAENIARALENDASVAGARLANLQAAIDQQKKVVASADADQVHLNELQRVAQALRDQLDSSLTKYQEAVATENSTSAPPDARIIAQATVPDQPAFPKKVPTLVFGTLAAFILSLGAVIGSEMLSDKAPQAVAIQRPVAARRTPGARRSLIAKALSSLKRFARSRWFAEDEAKPAEEDDDVEQEAENTGARVVARASMPQGVQIVATRLQEGEASAAALIGFARNLAQEGRPIIVDLDSRADQILPLVARPLETERMAGLTDLLDKGALFADVIHRDCASRLHFIPFGSGERFNPDDLDIVLDALGQTYDFVVLAAPPLTTSEMAKALAPYADFVVVAAPEDTSETETAGARAELNAAGASEILVVCGDPEEAPSFA